MKFSAPIRLTFSFAVTAALLLLSPLLGISSGAVQITQVTSNLTGNPAPGQTIQLTVNAVGPQGTNLSHQFYYKAGYGTDQFAGNTWQVVQAWSPANEVNYSFPSADNNYLIGHVVPQGETWQFGDAQGGFNVLIDGDVQITAVTSDLTGAPEVDDTIRFTVSASGPAGATLEYRFYSREGYGIDTATWGNTDWELVQDWSSANWVDYSFSDPGDYYLVGHVRVSGEDWEVGDPQGGFNVCVIDPDRPEGWTELTHGNDPDPNYDMLYAQDKVKRIDLIFNPADWQAMLDEMTQLFGPFGSGGQHAPGLTEDPSYRPCTLTFEDKTWHHVGARFKGQSTLWSSWSQGIMKLSFRFDTDEFEDDYSEIRNQRVFGFKELSLANNGMDASVLREKVTADIFREAGVPAPQTAFYRVFVDHGEGPIYFGLYTMVEVPREPMLESQFGDPDGNLYKAVINGPVPGASIAVYDPDGFEKKTNKDEDDFSDLEALYNALHVPRDNAAAWRAGLEAVLDVDGFLQWLAVNTLIQNWDTYGVMAQNYYLYSDPSDGLFHWIPWDNNMALQSVVGLAPPLSLCLAPEEVGDGWPLIRYLIDDPVYQPIYTSYVNETIAGAFSVASQQQRLQEAHTLISQYVVGLEGEQQGYTFTNPNAFETELDILFSHVESRQEAALQFLSDGTCPNIGSDDKVTATIVVPPQFNCTPEAIGAMFWTSFPPQPGTMPAGRGDTYPNPEITPGVPYQLTTTQGRLPHGEYYLSVVVSCPGGGAGGPPVPGIDWVAATIASPLTLGPGTGTVDAGTILLMPAIQIPQ